ncbi:hypothetical protein ACFFNY_08085 [Paenibacillus hodogayensis]|uniref:Uncharacterized protein n=1 Tax=Paenibacillus hodogayensis TaxID=279208 RepID=A0ABV5VTC9_9BACL
MQLGQYRQGTLLYNDNCVAGSFAGWVCVAGGTPGYEPEASALITELLLRYVWAELGKEPMPMPRITGS